MANITRGAFEKFGFPACHKRKSRMIREPFFTTGCDGGRSWARFSSKSILILPLALSPCFPSWAARDASRCVPSQISVLPFSGVISTKGTLTTNAKGQFGWSKSASECTGWDCGGDSGVGGIAVFPERKESLGLGPRTVEVTWVARGLSKILVSKYFCVVGGSCWMFLWTCT